jgi:hypothetical protein
MKFMIASVQEITTEMAKDSKASPEERVAAKERSSTASLATMRSLDLKYPPNPDLDGSDHGDITDEAIVTEVALKLQNVQLLQCENGSPILLERCTHPMMMYIRRGLRAMGKGVPRMFVERDRLFLEELSISISHERIVSAVCCQVADYNLGISGSSRSPMICYGRASYVFSGGDIVEPDTQFEVQSSCRCSCPNFVVEVAVLQNFEALHHKCCRYLNDSDNVMAVLGVKLFHPEGSDPRNDAMLALLYTRGCDSTDRDRRESIPTAAVSFGPGCMSSLLAGQISEVIGSGVTGYVEGADPLVPCNRAKLAPYLLRISRNLLLTATNEIGAVPSEFADAPDLTIDLFEILEYLLV